MNGWDEFRDSLLGSTVQGREGYSCFVPAPLPDEVALSPDLIVLLDKASRAVGTLSGVGETLPNPSLLTRPFQRREAVLSSRIEGTQASVSDVLRYEAFEDRAADRSEDVREVYNYLRAMAQGIELLRELPLSSRVVRNIHATLLQNVRGEAAHPGEFRDRQVWIGSPGAPVEAARFVPPPMEMVPELVSDWEHWINHEHPMPPLVKCALMHYQFEAIHPFLDGNGRVGRLLIMLFLSEQRVLTTPLLYLSPYFERNRTAYYDHLLEISRTGRWDRWLDFFLNGVLQEASDALERSRRVRALHLRYREILQRSRRSAAALRLLDEVFMRPILTAASAARALNISNQGARNLLERLTEDGILHMEEDSWPRFYVARELLAATE